MYIHKTKTGSETLCACWPNEKCVICLLKRHSNRQTNVNNSGGRGVGNKRPLHRPASSNRPWTPREGANEHFSTSYVSTFTLYILWSWNMYSNMLCTIFVSLSKDAKLNTGSCYDSHEKARAAVTSKQSHPPEASAGEASLFLLQEVSHFRRLIKRIW